MERRALPEQELIAMIRERLRGGDCAECVPTALSPIHPVAGGVNWQVLSQPSCSAPCQAAMLDMCGALAEEYEVAWPPA